MHQSGPEPQSTTMRMARYSTRSSLSSSSSSSSAMMMLLIIAAAFPATTHAFVGRPAVFGRAPSQSSSVAYRTNTDNDIDTAASSTSTSTPTPLAVESFLWNDDDRLQPTNNGYSTNGQQQQPSNGHAQPLPVADLAQRLEENKDPSLVEFVPSENYQEVLPQLASTSGTSSLSSSMMEQLGLEKDEYHYPFAAMLQGSAPYIASHLGETAVFYIPGEWLHKPNKLFDSFLQDVALSRLMGMKIVLVADCRMEADEQCSVDGLAHAHECHNALRATPHHAIRQIEEEAGYVRFEVERKLNRFLKTHLVSGGEDEPEGNVLGGNFYSARAFGVVKGQDFEHTGFVKNVYTDNIQQALDRNDVVLLTTVGCSSNGDSVNVNGHHLAATVAASLNAYKLIYMANEGSVLSQKGGDVDSNEQEPNHRKKFYQEIPLSFAKSLTDYHKVKAHKTGFANFEYARQNLEPRAVELLLNLAWSSWALEQGVTRAHVVNPKDGALLEELFTSKNGANTCLYHDDENLEDDDDHDWMSGEDAGDWNAFFSEAAAQEEQVGGPSN